MDRRAGRKIRERSRACSDEGCCRGRRSRVVLTPRRRRQVSGVLVGPTGLEQGISADDGDKNARSPGRARNKPLKPLRAGMPGDSGVPVASTPVLSTFAQGAAGAAGTRHSPRPPWGREINLNLGRIAPRDREAAFERHCERSEAIHSFFLLRPWMLRGACHRARIPSTRWLAMTALHWLFENLIRNVLAVNRPDRCSVCLRQPNPPSVIILT
jgi:hypothetical protein